MRPALLRAAGALTLTAMLCGCTYDYLQRSDRVAYSAGDSVRANIERETANPARRSSTYVGGLGKNGQVTPISQSETAASPSD